MNGFVIYPLKLKNLLCLGRKFLSSAALTENSAAGCAENQSKPNPLRFVLNSANLRGLTLKDTEIAHALLLRTHALYTDVIAANDLLDSYTGYGRVDQAFKLFEEIPQPNLVSWNLIISGCNKNFRFDDSWGIFCEMRNKGVHMDEFTYGSVLAACGASDSMLRGEQVYAFVLKNGFFSNGYVKAGMIDLFSRSCRSSEALRVLYDVHSDNVVCWNVMVSGLVKNNDNWVALEVFRQMCRHGSLTPNAFMFSSVFTACGAIQALDFGKSIHGRVIICGAGADVFVGTATVHFYTKCGAMSDAIKQFQLMPTRNVVSWTAIISGFVCNGDSVPAIQTFTEMLKSREKINEYTISSVLAACSNLSMFKEAIQIHCWVVKVGLYVNSVVKSSLLTMYSKVGAIDLSEKAFEEAHDLKLVGIWNNMIAAFVQNEVYEKAVVFFHKMLKEGIKPDKFSTSSVLSIIDSLILGRQLHGFALKSGLALDITVGSSMFTMYSKCGYLKESLKSFEELERKDTVSWTSMIAGLAEHGCADKALELFRDMQFEKSLADEKILISVLTACSDLHSMKLGREVHGFSLRCGFVEETLIGGALVHMYSKCGDLNSARIVFHRMPFKDQVSWSSLVSGVAQKGHIEEALQLFHNMLLSDLSIDAFTISSIIGALEISHHPGIGPQLHVHIIKWGLESDASVGSSLVMLYSKCGSIDDCRQVFRQIRTPDLVSWTTLIASYAHQGKGSEALQLFNLMKKSGVEPDAVTFVGVLSACCHSGLVEEGYFHLNSMIKDYGIEPGCKHYTCMVDLLGRAGRLKEAESFILNMPIEPDNLVWETLLAACQVHGNSELGKIAAQKIMQLQPSDAGAYISLSNICADAGEWDHVLKIRSLMSKSRARKKEPGWSSL